MGETPSAVIKYSRYVNLITKNEHLAFFKLRPQFFVTSKVVRKLFNKSFSFTVFSYKKDIINSNSQMWYVTKAFFPFLSEKYHQGNELQMVTSLVGKVLCAYL